MLFHYVNIMLSSHCKPKKLASLFDFVTLRFGDLEKSICTPTKIWRKYSVNKVFKTFAKCVQIIGLKVRYSYKGKRFRIL